MLSPSEPMGQQLTGSNRFEKWCAWFSKWPCSFYYVRVVWIDFTQLFALTSVRFLLEDLFVCTVIHEHVFAEHKCGTDLPTPGLNPKKRSWHWSHLRPVTEGWAHTHCPEWAAHTWPTAPTEWQSHTSQSLSPASDRKKPVTTYDANKQTVIVCLLCTFF